MEEIAATLRSSSPLVSVAEFVGQSNSGGSSDITMNQSKGLTQKEQQKVSVVVSINLVKPRFM